MADEITPEKLAEEIRKLKIEDLVLSTVTTLGQLAYAKLEAKDSTRRASRSTRSRRCCRRSRVTSTPTSCATSSQVLANVRLAYADAARARASRRTHDAGRDRRLRRQRLLLAARGRRGGRRSTRRTGRRRRRVTIGDIGGKRVAFLPRHGRAHELPPAQINYRANVWAMKELGVRRIIGPNASGALKAELAARRVRRLRPVRRPHVRAQGHLLRGPGDDARLRRRSVLPRPAADPRRDRARARHPGARRRHRRRHQRPALLDARRVALVPGRGLGHDQHDRVPRGLPRARARALLREHLDGHRPRRRRGGRAARSRTTTCSASSTRTTRSSGSSSSRPSRRSARSRRTSAQPRWKAPVSSSLPRRGFVRAGAAQQSRYAANIVRAGDR